MLSILIGYLAGSVPFAFLLARRRASTCGSRAAATSALRT
jgi:glycerol-3-phosphate acyltransferase PlsY